MKKHSIFLFGVKGLGLDWRFYCEGVCLVMEKPRNVNISAVAVCIEKQHDGRANQELQRIVFSFKCEIMLQFPIVP